MNSQVYKNDCWMDKFCELSKERAGCGSKDQQRQKLTSMEMDQKIDEIGIPTDYVFMFILAPSGLYHGTLAAVLYSHVNIG